MTVYTPDQQKKLRMIEKRFIVLHGERKWVRLNYCLKQGLKQVEIVRAVQRSRRAVRYWISKIKSI
jgi:hypothetical protein